MMKSEGAPQIGFDRFIQLDWARAALRVRAGFSDPEDLAQLIDETHSGAARQEKDADGPSIGFGWNPGPNWQNCVIAPSPFTPLTQGHRLPP